ncbi:hypothetical protein [Paenibacillus sp. HW567]|uniref:hypothetical protein n=1 Tax=Paenibacillus sp. HW567 TaxID=1034769 RepID=UPI000374F7CD|nr:hypothetical protein [Paenibacillus sp. HW567]
MNIEITGKGLKKDEVHFGTDFGEGKGIWCGTPVKPGDQCTAEFELPALLMRWVDIVPVSGGGYGIRTEGNDVILTGVLENIEEDGTGCLRLGEDSIMLECLGEPMALGGFVEIRAKEIRMYPAL